jgi:hypothetical protein
MGNIKATPMKLPTSLSEPSSNLQDYSMLWFGREKIGKTTLGSMFPDSLFLMCEPGGKALRIHKIDIHNWYEFKGAVAEVLKDKRYRTIIVDTVDKAYDYCQEAVCLNLAIEHPSEEEWGKGWGKVRTEFAQMMTALAHCGKGLILTSHARETEIKRRGGASTTRITPTMAAGARGVLEPMVDIWAYFTYTDDGGREIWLRGDEVVAAGHRLQDHFVGVDRVNMGKSAQEGYQAFMAAWERGKQKGGDTEKPKARISLTKRT